MKIYLKDIEALIDKTNGFGILIPGDLNITEFESADDYYESDRCKDLRNRLVAFITSDKNHRLIILLK